MLWSFALSSSTCRGGARPPLGANGTQTTGARNLTQRPQAPFGLPPESPASQGNCTTSEPEPLVTQAHRASPGLRASRLTPKRHPPPLPAGVATDLPLRGLSCVGFVQHPARYICDTLEALPSGSILLSLPAVDVPPVRILVPGRWLGKGPVAVCCHGGISGWP